jgi:hypothetical protein
LACNPVANRAIWSTAPDPLRLLTSRSPKYCQGHSGPYRSHAPWHSPCPHAIRCKAKCQEKENQDEVPPSSRALPRKKHGYCPCQWFEWRNDSTRVSCFHFLRLQTGQVSQHTIFNINRIHFAEF